MGIDKDHTVKKEFTKAELSYFSGEFGGPILIAVEGIVYDVSESQFWQHGRHQVFHKAGQDLTEELADAPHGAELIRKFPVVGYLLDDD
ncbi:MAG: cytochrome B5 [Anaerolineaceae bacterium]|nr:cytochrome B5 [Anaerolineaceae bacterium]